MTRSKSTAGFAAAAALIALSGASFAGTAQAAGAKAVHCYGVNACKGQSDCKAGNHDCKGMNDCKGQGFKELTSKACAAQGGSLTAPGN
ncbi:BufA2 family periplasmic bufferin-type metallophore [Sphingomonas quercus]|uniref:Integral membrane protein n=1 Tax=Sphingomonas quercus TaxID=2842451 RepID=A0ABS6BKV4_9SPHN|nr:hypothetical protein [Sphingomonas quercus]MBU3077860.1 hypothetical protein [Sphingomonas quercus]